MYFSTLIGLNKTLNKTQIKKLTIIVYMSAQDTQCACSSCGKTFTCRRNLDKHIEKNACKQYSNYCKFCRKGFTTETSMYRHMRSSCKIKKEDDVERDKIYEKLIAMEEQVEKVTKENAKMAKENAKIVKENKHLTRMIKSIETAPMVKGDHNNVNINTGTVNNTNNIILVGYGKEDLSKLDKAEILKALQNGYYSTVKLTEAVHFNPKYPEYHNVYISNMKDKYAMMHDGKRWTLTMKEDLINQIYEDKKNYIEENLEDFIDSLTPSRKRALERWLDTDDDDKKIKEIKDSIKLLLYNSRHLPLKYLEEETGIKGDDKADEKTDDRTDDTCENVVKMIKRSGRVSKQIEVGNTSITSSTTSTVKGGREIVKVVRKGLVSKGKLTK
ncbi:hypothetical protein YASMINEVIRUS_374 [Yasminevirus sp. GU-2018]|uniref:C2H2-type domain-containing protein n=1 Tax=Yasminevirus sp. GU-2018 TaxID=2420051 RepID=A0A5K0U8Q3_9VIRU|nr:hypothetical protein YASMINEVIRUS_374 [Yasminevirus sp. GU-2018]